MANMNYTGGGLAVSAGSPGLRQVSGTGVLVPIVGAGVVSGGRRGSSPAVPGVLCVHGFVRWCLSPLPCGGIPHTSWVHLPGECPWFRRNLVDLWALSGGLCGLERMLRDRKEISIYIGCLSYGGRPVEASAAA